MITAVIIMIFAAAFLSVLAIFSGIQSYRQSPAAEMKRRLRKMAATQEAGFSSGFTSELLVETTPTEEKLYRFPLMTRVKRLVEHSGVRITALRFVLITLLVAVTGFLAVFFLTGNRIAPFLALLLFGVTPFFYLLYRKKQRITLFDEQFPDALTMIARSLRAGHSLSGAIELISQEMPQPTAGLFRIAYDQQQLGMRIAESLMILPDKIESLDLHFFITIIRINSESGGNLAEILDKLADTVRSRLQIRRQVKTCTAEGRMSGYVLTALPVIIFVAFNFLNPVYMKVFFTEPICQFALLAGVLAQCLGYLMMRKIVDIRI